MFCAVSAWSRFRFVRFADNEKAATTFALLAECFEVLGGVPKTVLADRMGCLKSGVVANVVVPTPDYVRFATHYGFRPDFCEAADPESKGMVEHLVGYAKTRSDGPAATLRRSERGQRGGRGVVRGGECRHPFGDLRGPGRPAGHRAAAVAAAAVAAARARRPKPVSRKVDRLSCVRFGSARYSVPCRLIGHQVTITTTATIDHHDRAGDRGGAGRAPAGRPRARPASSTPTTAAPDPDRPSRAPRPRTQTEKNFLALGPVAEAFLVGAAAAGVSKLPTELADIATLQAAHGTDAVAGRAAPGGGVPPLAGR